MGEGERPLTTKQVKAMLHYIENYSQYFNKMARDLKRLDEKAKVWQSHLYFVKEGDARQIIDSYYRKNKVEIGIVDIIESWHNFKRTKDDVKPGE